MYEIMYNLTEISYTASTLLKIAHTEKDSPPVCQYSTSGATPALRYSISLSGSLTRPLFRTKPLGILAPRPDVSEVESCLEEPPSYASSPLLEWLSDIFLLFSLRFLIKPEEVASE